MRVVLQESLSNTIFSVLGEGATEGVSVSDGTGVIMSAGTHYMQPPLFPRGPYGERIRLGKLDTRVPYQRYTRELNGTDVNGFFNFAVGRDCRPDQGELGKPCVVRGVGYHWRASET